MRKILMVGIVIGLMLLVSTVNAFSPELPIGMTENQYNWNPSTQVMTDNNGLTYKNETNGVITVNNERFLAFGLKATVGATDYTWTSMDFNWTWHKEQNGEDYVFWAENDYAPFTWRQYYYFYEDPWKPMKIKHYLENNYADATDVQMYYMTSVEDTDTIERNETSYLVGDVKPLHIQKDLNDEVAVVNFNSMFDFRFDDLIDNGFTINEFYLGSAGFLGYPSLDVMVVGFTKNNGVFPFGAEVWIDPTFSANAVESIAVAPLDSDSIIVAWGDETEDDRTFAIYNTDETVEVVATDVDTDAGSCAYTSVAVAALNSTHFVIGWFDSNSMDASFAIYNSSGGIVVSEVDVDTDAGSSSYSVSVSALNSTHFVIGWFDSNSMDASFAICNSSGGIVVSEVDVDTDAGSSSYSVSVSALNSTHFVIGWFDDTDDDASFRVYNSGGTALTDIIDADTTAVRYQDVGSYEAATGIGLASDRFVMGWARSSTQAVWQCYDSGGGTYPYPTKKFYETSTSDFSAEVAVIDLYTSRDGTGNSVNYELASGNLYNYVNATSNITVGEEIKIPAGTDVSFSAYFDDGDRVDAAYATWKFYKVYGSTAVLICQKGDDGTGGVKIPDGTTETITGSCTPTSDVTLNSTDTVRLLMNVWAQTIGGGGAATKVAKHYWDDTNESWVEYKYQEVAAEEEGTTPSISNVTNGTINSTAQWIDWDVNQSCSNRVKYSNESDLTPTYWSDWDNATAAPNINIGGLTAGTTYYYQAWSYNTSNSSLMSNSTTLSFTTAATDTSFTVTLPVGYAYAHFNLTGVTNPSTQTNYEPEGQNSTEEFYNVTNTGNVNLDVRMQLNTTITNVVLKADTDNNPTGAKEVNTSLVTIYSDLAQGNSVDIWMWSDFSHAIEQVTNKTLSINVSQ